MQCRISIFHCIHACNEPLYESCRSIFYVVILVSGMVEDVVYIRDSVDRITLFGDVLCVIIKVEILVR